MNFARSASCCATCLASTADVYSRLRANNGRWHVVSSGETAHQTAENTRPPACQQSKVCAVKCTHALQKAAAPPASGPSCWGRWGPPRPYHGLRIYASKRHMHSLACTLAMVLFLPSLLAGSINQSCQQGIAPEGQLGDGHIVQHNVEVASTLRQYPPDVTGYHLRVQGAGGVGLRDEECWAEANPQVAADAHSRVLRCRSRSGCRRGLYCWLTSRMVSSCDALYCAITLFSVS